MPGGESLAGVCAGLRRRRSHRRAAGAQRRSASHRRPCGGRSSPTSLNAGFPGRLTPRRRDDCGVPQQAGRRLTRQVTRSAGRERPRGLRGKPPSALERGVAHAPIAVLRCRQAAADAAARCEAVSGRLTASTWRAASCTGEAIESEGSRALLRGCAVSFDGGDKSPPAFCPLLCPLPAVIPVL